MINPGLLHVSYSRDSYITILKLIEIPGQRSTGVKSVHVIP